jgi:hypothetical protein
MSVPSDTFVCMAPTLSESSAPSTRASCISHVPSVGSVSVIHVPPVGSVSVAVSSSVELLLLLLLSVLAIPDRKEYSSVCVVMMLGVPFC